MNTDPLVFRVVLEGRSFRFFWGYTEEELSPIGPSFDLTKLSDEYCKAGEFTGTHVGLFCCDQLFHKKTADFDWFDVDIDESTEPGEE